jgi:hypothetical protein
MMTIAEFLDAYRDSDESVMSIAELAVRRNVKDDPEFLSAAKVAVKAEDDFYEL